VHATSAIQFKRRRKEKKKEKISETMRLLKKETQAANC